MNKRGMKKIRFSLPSIILLVLLGIAIIAGVLVFTAKNVIEQNSEQLSLGKKTLDLEMTEVKILGEDFMKISVKRNSGDGEFIGLNFVLIGNKETETIEFNISMEEGEEQSFSLILSEIETSDLKRISVVPVYKLESGKEIIGNVKDKYKIEEPEEEINETETNETEECTDNCNDLGYECGYYTICNETVLCGNCSNGFVCSEGECVLDESCTDTCDSLNYQCGYHIICEESFNCGVCQIGYECNSNGTCVKEEINIEDSEDENFNIYFQHNFEDNAVGLYNEPLINEDFNNPGRAEIGYGSNDDKIFIEEESGNKFMKSYMDSGKKMINGSGLEWIMHLEDETQDELYASYRFKFSENMATEYVANPWGGIYPLHWLTGKNSIAFKTYNGWGEAGDKPGSDEGFCVLVIFDSGHPRDSSSPDKIKNGYYIYHQEMGCSSNCGGDPEDYIYYGEPRDVDYLFSPNTWYEVTIRVALNDPWTSNGLVEYFVNGELVASYNDFRFRDTTALTIELVDMAFFLGGGGSYPDEDGWWAIDDVVIYDYKPGISGIPYGTTPSSSGRTISPPY